MSILDISPDGSEFLLLQSDLNDETQRGTIWTMPVLGGAAKRLGNITARGASYSPDGKLIAFNEKESVYVCDRDGQNVKEIWNTHHMVHGQSRFFAGLQQNSCNRVEKHPGDGYYEDLGAERRRQQSTSTSSSSALAGWRRRVCRNLDAGRKTFCL